MRRMMTYAAEEDRMEVDRDANDVMIVEGAGAGQPRPPS